MPHSSMQLQFILQSFKFSLLCTLYRQPFLKTITQRASLSIPTSSITELYCLLPYSETGSTYQVERGGTRLRHTLLLVSYCSSSNTSLFSPEKVTAMPIQERQKSILKMNSCLHSKRKMANHIHKQQHS